jgi:2-methylcitrate dehydratase PrpD
MTIAEALADSAVAARNGAIDSSAREWARLRLVDGVVTAASAAALGEGLAATRRAARTEGGAGPVLIALGTSSPSAADAALANGMLTSALEFDDTDTASYLHPGAAVIPAVLAVAGQRGESIEAVEQAIVLGYGAACLTAEPTVGRLQDRGFHTSTFAVFGAALAAGYLMGLDRAELVSALGIAGSMSSGITEYLTDGSSAKQIHMGWAAQSGIVAAELAAAGCTGPATVLEGLRGVQRLFGGVEPGEAPDIDEADVFSVVSRVSAKRYPACYAVHPYLELWHDAAIKSGLSDQELRDRIASVVCISTPGRANMLLEPAAQKAAPPTLYAARFSLPFCLAYEIEVGGFGLRSLTERSRTDSAILARAATIRYELDYADLDAKLMASGLRVGLDDGVEYLLERTVVDAPDYFSERSFVADKCAQLREFAGNADNAANDWLTGLATEAEKELQAQRPNGLADLLRLAN